LCSCFSFSCRLWRCIGWLERSRNRFRSPRQSQRKLPGQRLAAAIG
jgi:hypothetical protein